MINAIVSANGNDWMVKAVDSRTYAESQVPPIEYIAGANNLVYSAVWLEVPF